MADDNRVLLVQAEWSRPKWCRDDWCLIRLYNGYRGYMPNAVVEFDGPAKCWVRAQHLWDIYGAGRSQAVTEYEVKFLDYDGEGSQERVPRSFTKEVERERPRAD